MRLVLALAMVFLCVAASGQTPPPSFSIQWNRTASTVRVTGEMTSSLRALSGDKLQDIFPVTVEPANPLASIGLPAILGTYTVSSNAILFQPRFPFEPGVVYRATFTPKKLSGIFRMPQRKLSPSTVVSEIYPTSEVLPQNLLKFYLHFSAPMSGGGIYRHIQLLQADGRPVELPFLEIDEELWNPEMTRLTIFLDPGRIKRGVRPLEEVGPALVPGESYTLVVDEAWPDALGTPLKAPFRKKFRVVPPDREPPDPKAWAVTLPKAQTREPLVIKFSEPMDHALALRMVYVASLAGKTATEKNETVWKFEPDLPWVPGSYAISVQSTIEDMAGNNVGKPFEVDLEDGNRPRDPPTTISLPFRIE